MGVDEFRYSSISEGVSEKKAFSEPETKADATKSKNISSIPTKVPNVKDLMIALMSTNAIIKIDSVCSISNANMFIKNN